MVKILRGFLERMGAKSKGRIYKIDPEMPFVPLISFAFRKLSAVLRGRIYFPFRRQIFAGRDVVLKNRSLIHLGRGVNLEQGVMIDGLARDGIVLGAGVSLGMYTIVRATCTLETIGRGLEIGESSSCDAFCFFGASGGIKIGKNVLIGARVNFHSENHNFDDLSIPIAQQGTSRQGIVVGDNCWVGSNVTILDGAHLSAGCVVAAGAVVRGYFGPDSVIAGVPARVVRQRGRHE